MLETLLTRQISLPRCRRSIWLTPKFNKTYCYYSKWAIKLKGCHLKCKWMVFNRCSPDCSSLAIQGCHLILFFRVLISLKEVWILTWTSTWWISSWSHKISKELPISIFQQTRHLPKVNKTKRLRFRSISNF